MSSDFVLERFRGVVAVVWMHCYCSLVERTPQGFFGWLGFRGCGLRFLSGPAVLFFFSPLPSSSPFLLSGPAWVLFPFFCVCAARTATLGGGRSVRSTIAFCLFFSFLSPRAGPPLPPLSLPLFLSLSLLHWIGNRLW